MRLTKALGTSPISDTKKLVQLRGEIPAGVRAGRQRGDEVDAVLHAVGGRPGRDRLAAVRIDRKRECLLRGVVRVRRCRRTRRARRRRRPRALRQVPAGEHARGGVDVGLRVVADAQREQLHDLAAEVLLRPLARVGGPSSQTSIAGSFAISIRIVLKFPSALSRSISIWPRTPAGSSDALAAMARVPFGRAERGRHLRIRGGEVVVPEERHLLLERPVGVHHPEEPALPGGVDSWRRARTRPLIRVPAYPAWPIFAVDIVGDALVVRP